MVSTLIHLASFQNVNSDHSLSFTSKKEEDVFKFSECFSPSVAGRAKNGEKSLEPRTRRPRNQASDEDKSSYSASPPAVTKHGKNNEFFSPVECENSGKITTCSSSTLRSDGKSQIFSAAKVAKELKQKRTLKNKTKKKEEDLCSAAAAGNNHSSKVSFLREADEERFV